MNSDFIAQLSDNRAIRLAVTAVLVLLALFLLVSTISASKNMGRSGLAATEVITVNGEGQATMAPDVARVSFTVQNTAATVAEAQSETTQQSNTVIDSVKAQGIEGKDIKTLAYNISPQYSYQTCASNMPCEQNPKITGYEVAQTIQVTVRDLAKVSDLLASLGKLQVQKLSGPDFALDDSTAGHNAAREDAINKAKEQADKLAEQLGVRLGKIVSYNESSGGYPTPMMSYGMGGAVARDMKAEVAPNIPAGENTYSATVSITYEIR